MSLGDYLRLLRAKRGGITPWEIEGLTDLPQGLYRQIEQRYRSMGDDETLRILADFYEVDVEDLRWRMDWPRKALSKALVRAMEQELPLTVNLWNGETLTGQVRWWDLGAFGLDTPTGGEVVVQRHAVERWEPPMAAEVPGSMEEAKA